MDASGGEVVQLSTGKDDGHVHPPRIGEASAILVVGSPLQIRSRLEHGREVVISPVL